MKNILKKVESEIEAGNIGSNKSCPYHPTHFTDQNCSFCYCPFYPCRDQTFGYDLRTEHGNVWACSDCLFIHRNDVVKFIFEKIEVMNLKAGDPRFLETVFPEAKKKFYKKGKALMLIGARQDLEMSVFVAVIGKKLHEKGLLVSPFKPQLTDEEVTQTVRKKDMSSRQYHQAKRMGLTVPDLHMNPILLSEKDDRFEVVIEGEPSGEYDSKSYYSEFVAEKCESVLRRNLHFLKDRYDRVIVDGTYSSSDSIFKDYNIPNLIVAKIAEADLLIVVDGESEDVMGLAIGIMETLPPNDCARVKGIIISDPNKELNPSKELIQELENLTGVPVAVTTIKRDIDLQSDDLNSVADSFEKEIGRNSFKRMFE